MSKLLCSFFALFSLMEAFSQNVSCSQFKQFRYTTAASILADERLKQYDLKHVFLDLNADNTSTALSGKATLLLEATEEISTLVLELIDELTISSVNINDVSVSFTHINELVEIDLDQSYPSGTLIHCEISYSGAPTPEPGIFSGINNAFSNAWENQVTWTLSEPFNAKMWWPCKQVLSDKIDSVWVFVTTDDHLKVGSNGLLTTTSLANNKIRYEWKTSYPIAYYLISMTIGEYVAYNNYAKPQALENDSILIQNFIYNNPETLPYYKAELDDIPAMVELFSDHYGLYPFYEEKYGHVMAPFSGGMEHQTMSSMGLFTFSLDAHELAHQWFGDLVTCATWQDIWINEGFARFSEYLALEKILSKQNAQAYRTNDMSTVTSSEHGSVYVPESSADDPSRIFNSRLTYMKGGLIIHMLREIVNNDTLFFQALSAFLNEYGHSTATGEDFKNVLETVTGMEFDPFFEQWYYGEGHPVFDITWFSTPDSLLLTINQTAVGTSELFTTPLEFVMTYANNETDTFRISQSQRQEQFHLAVEGTLTDLQFDPNEWLIKQVERFAEVDSNGNALGADAARNLFIYPNPVSEILSFSTEVSDISILDASGKVIFSRPSTSRINVKSWKAGIYFATFQLNGKFLTRKILKR